MLGAVCSKYLRYTVVGMCERNGTCTVRHMHALWGPHPVRGPYPVCSQLVDLETGIVIVMRSTAATVASVERGKSWAVLFVLPALADGPQGRLCHGMGH